MPSGAGSARSWPNYSTEVWKILNHDPDLVLIDGRFRVSCFLQAILRLSVATKYAFHDFWSRPYYHVVLQFANVVTRVDDLAVFQIDPTTDWRAVAIAASEYLLDPR
jgi:hypothetical protein